MDSKTLQDLSARSTLKFLRLRKWSEKLNKRWRLVVMAQKPKCLISSVNCFILYAEL